MKVVGFDSALLTVDFGFPDSMTIVSCPFTKIVSIHD